MKQQIMFGSRGPGPGADEKFSIKKVPGALASLPRVLRLVWSTSAILTILLGLLSPRDTQRDSSKQAEK